MLIAAHSIVAGYVGEEIGNPFLAFLVGIIIHFILDLVPHYDTTDKGKFTFRQILLIGIDGIVAILLLYYILKDNNYNLSYIAGVIGGILPDLLDNVPLWKKRFRKTKFGKWFHTLHQIVHQKQPSLVIGLATQIILIILFTLLALSHKRLF